ncbi:SH3 domain-containing protein [Clostridium sp. JNZ X4-2]
MEKLLKTCFRALVIGTSLLIPFSVSAASITGNDNISSSSITEPSINTTQKSSDLKSNVKPAWGEPVVVNANAVNFRSQPNTSSTILRQFNKGTQLTFLNYESNGWYHVAYKSSSGWIYGYVYGKYINR